jgi:hypothetical protein
VLQKTEALLHWKSSSLTLIAALLKKSGNEEQLLKEIE